MVTGQSNFLQGVHFLADTVFYIPYEYSLDEEFCSTRAFPPR